MRVISILAYTFGGLLIFIGLLFSLISAIGGLFIILAGLFLLPRTRYYLESKSSLQFTRIRVAGIVVLFTIVGFAIITVSLPPVSNGPGSSPIPQGEAKTAKQNTPASENENREPIVTVEAHEVLPTIEDFDADWIGGIQDNNKSVFYNSQNDNLLVYNVTVHPDIASAKTDFKKRRTTITQRGLGTESFNAGDEGFLYKLDRKFLVVIFREQNVVARVEYDAPGSLFPETSSIKHVHRQDRKIRDHLG